MATGTQSTPSAGRKPTTAPDAAPAPVRPRHGSPAQAAATTKQDNTVRASRWGQLCNGWVLGLLYPPRITLQEDCVELRKAPSLKEPWKLGVQRMAMSRIAAFRQVSGVTWDAMIFKTVDGATELRIDTLRKKDATALSRVLGDRFSITRGPSSSPTRK